MATPYYATKADFLAYVEGATVTDDAVLNRLLVRAEEDVDAYLWNWGRLESNGRRFGHPKTTNEKALTPQQVTALTRITCARAEYRQIMGEDFFRRSQYSAVSGPDFSTQGQLDRVGPKVREEIARSGLTYFRHRSIKAVA